MGMLSLEAQDFCCFPALKLRLRKRGLVWIGGENNDTHSATSNGAGKSTVFKTIGWAGYGKSVDGKDGDEVIRHGAKMAQTNLALTDGYSVLRERRKSGPKVILLRDGVELKMDRTEIQPKIDELLGMDWQTFRNVALYGQRDNKRFIHPETSDRERKEVLGRILRTTIYGVAHGWVKENVLRLKKAADVLRADVEKAEARLGEYDLEDLERQRKEWEESRKRRIANLGDQVRTFLDAAKELLKDAPDVDALEARLSELRNKQRAAKALEDDIEALVASSTPLADAVLKANNDLNKAQHVFDSAERAFEKLYADDSGLCPLCQGPLGEGSAADHGAELKAAVDAAEKALKKATKVARDAATELAEKNNEIRRARVTLKAEREAVEAIPDVQEELAEARSVKDRSDAKKAQAKLTLEQAQAVKVEANPVDEQIKRAEERIAVAKRAIKVAKGSLTETNHEAAHYEFWNKGYSPTGLPSFALDAVMPMLTERANVYLETLADGDITVNFSTQRELKSAKGEYRDEIAVEWEVEGIGGYPPSGGQWKKLEVATNFALMDLVAAQEGASSDILLLDEVFDGLDPEGVDRVGHLLQKLRSKRETIMVISHSATMQEWFERALIVEKKDGASILTAA